HSTFMLAHVLSPHMPLVFDRDGNLPELPCDWACRPFRTEQGASGLTEHDFYDLLAGQVHGLNTEILITVDAVVEAEPEAIIILFSDHGARTEPEELSEFYATFFAARTPKQPAIFPDDARP